MEKHDLPLLSQRMAQLAEVLTGAPKGLSPGALLVWLDALKHIRFDDVQAALTEWPKKNARMPVPADIVKLAGEHVSSRVEAAGQKNRSSTGAVADLQHARPNPNSPIARAELAKIQHILGGNKGGMVALHFQQIGGNNALDPKDWARVLRVKEAAGDHLSIVQREAWRSALDVPLTEPA